jgi:hypothetical protein
VLALGASENFSNDRYQAATIYTFLFVVLLAVAVKWEAITKKLLQWRKLRASPGWMALGMGITLALGIAIGIVISPPPPPPLTCSIECAMANATPLVFAKQIKKFTDSNRADWGGFGPWVWKPFGDFLSDPEQYKGISPEVAAAAHYLKEVFNSKDDAHVDCDRHIERAQTLLSNCVSGNSGCSLEKFRELRELCRNTLKLGLPNIK